MSRIQIQGVQEGETLYFLHIPKTAGGTLIHLLDDFYDENEIFPALVLSELACVPDLLDAIDRARFIRGHFDTLVLPLIRRPVVTFTMLRNPVERALSQYAHAIHHPQVAYWDTEGLFSAATPIGSFLDTQYAPDFLGNVQVRSLTSEWSAIDRPLLWDNSRPSMPDDTRLALAKRRLDQCRVVGVQERFDESLRLLAFTLGFPLPKAFNRYNTGLGPRQRDDLDPKSRERMASLNRLDSLLYAYGCSRFESDYEAMRQTLDERYPELRGSLDDQIHTDYQSRSVSSTRSRDRAVLPADPSHVHLELSAALIGTNWYPREPHNARTFRWTGPGTESTIELDLCSRHDYTIEIDTLGAVNMDALNSFTFRVNDTDISLQRVDAPSGPHFHGAIPADALVRETRQCLHFIVERPVTTSDGRTLGLAVLSLDLARR